MVGSGARGGAGPLPVPAIHRAEPAIAQVAHGRHAGGELPLQPLCHHGVQLIVGVAGDPIQGAITAVGDQVHVGVDQHG